MSDFVGSGDEDEEGKFGGGSDRNKGQFQTYSPSLPIMVLLNMMLKIVQVMPPRTQTTSTTTS